MPVHCLQKAGSSVGMQVRIQTKLLVLGKPQAFIELPTWGTLEL